MAVATLTFVYADSTAVLGPLALRAEPGCYDLCRAHAQGMSAPRSFLGDACRLSYGVGESHEIVGRMRRLVLVEWQPDDVPAARRRHPLRVGPAQVVTARFRAKCQRPEHSHRVGIDVRERGDSHVGACRPRATPSHVRTLAPRKARAPDCWRMSCESRAAAHHHASGTTTTVSRMPDRRDRHQRGMRGPLAPPNSVAGRALRRDRPVARAEFFVQSLSESLARITAAAPEALVGVEVGLEDVPDMAGQWSTRVPLAAAQEATPTTPARIVVYRRPIEHRATTRRQLRSLIHGTLIEQVSALTGIPVERLDPDDEDDED